MALVTRRADGRLSKAKEIAGGALRIPAVLTRAGVFEYRRDSKPWFELRPLDEVMREDSLASLQAAPSTDLHPRDGSVTLLNRKGLEVGHVADNVRADATDPMLVSADIVVTDPGTIDKIRRDERSEISCGYTCDLDETPGEFEGQRYDAVQRNIKYNHAALLPRGHGRAGGTVALRLDSAGNEITPRERVDSQETIMPTVKIDGIDLDPSTPAFTQAFDIYRARADAAIARAADLEKERDTAQGRADAAEESAQDLKAKLTEASDPKRLDSLAAERAELVTSARKVAGAEFKVDGLDADGIRRAVLEAKGVELNDRSADYVEARFDSLVESADAGTAAAAAKSLRTPLPVPRIDAATPAAPPTPAWQEPCAVSTRKA